MQTKWTNDLFRQTASEIQPEVVPETMSQKKTKMEMSLSKLRQRLATLENLITEQWKKMNEYELYNGQNAQYLRLRSKLEEYEAEQSTLRRAYQVIKHYQDCGIPYGDETMVCLTIQEIEVVTGSGYEFICKCGESVITENREVEKIECPKCGKYIWSKSLIKVKIVRE